MDNYKEMFEAIQAKLERAALHKQQVIDLARTITQQARLKANATASGMRFGYLDMNGELIENDVEVKGGKATFQIATNFPAGATSPNEVPDFYVGIMVSGEDDRYDVRVTGYEPVRVVFFEAGPMGSDQVALLACAALKAKVQAYLTAK